ncbi:hypothetical protein XP1712_17440 [Xanthomonas perforans]|nr:hypothetical protein XP1712_17440 [Xanthomonas perforans]
MIEKCMPEAVFNTLAFLITNIASWHCKSNWVRLPVDLSSTKRVNEAASGGDQTSILLHIHKNVANL